MSLDDLQAIRRLDPDGMLEHIARLPQQCRAAWAQSQGLELPPQYASVNNVTIVGMGGSAIGGALLKRLVAHECPVSISVVRDYSLPAFAEGPRSLVVACSYSGNTEETLSCFRQALARQTQTLAVTTGGQLSNLAREAAAPVLQFDYRSQPRAAIGYSFVLLLGIAYHLSLVRDYSDDVAEAATVMETWQEDLRARVPTSDNAAKQLAKQISGNLPVVYGAGHLAAVANRWKTQLNENAKHWACFDVLPELNHNAVVGLGIPTLVRDHSLVLMLRSGRDPRPIQERWNVTAELLAREGVTAEQLHGRGRSALAEMLSLIHFGDYVSFYLAMCNQVDPTPVATIAFLKQRLSEVGGARG